MGGHRAKEGASSSIISKDAPRASLTQQVIPLPPGLVRYPLFPNPGITPKYHQYKITLS